MTSTILRLAALACGMALAAPPHTAYREISLADLHNKIAGGWAGQMIGVSFGAPTEFRTLGKINEGALPRWTPSSRTTSMST